MAQYNNLQRKQNIESLHVSFEPSVDESSTSNNFCTLAACQSFPELPKSYSQDQINYFQTLESSPSEPSLLKISSLENEPSLLMRNVKSELNFYGERSSEHKAKSTPNLFAKLQRPIKSTTRKLRAPPTPIEDGPVADTKDTSCTLRNLHQRIYLKEENLLCHFQNVVIGTKEDCDHIFEVISGLCAPLLPQKVSVFANYDDTIIHDDVVEYYAEVCLRLTQNYYKQVTRYTTKNFVESIKKFEGMLLQKKVQGAKLFKTKADDFIENLFVVDGDAVGSGAFGEVRLAFSKTDGRKVALKRLSKQRIRALDLEDYVKREIEIMKLMHHPNIVSLERVVETDDCIYMIMDYLEGGTLSNPLDEHEMFEEPVARKLFKQIAEAIYYIHSKGVIHRDLQLSNICLDRDGNVKVIDFGISDFYVRKSSSSNSMASSTKTSGSPSPVVTNKMLGSIASHPFSLSNNTSQLFLDKLDEIDINSMHHMSEKIVPPLADTAATDIIEHEIFCGNCQYCAPEMLLGKHYTTSVDIWAIGVILFKLVTGYMPFRSTQHTLLGLFDIPLEEEPLSEECKDLIRKILTVDVSKRITIEAILSHPWLTQAE